MGINEIIDVQISVQDKSVTRAGFGVALILGTSTKISPDRIREYADMTAVAVDFSSSDEEYKAASIYFSQDERPRKVKIGRKDSGDADFKEALDAISAIDDDWYGLIVCTKTLSDIKDCADWIQARRKIFGFSTDNADIKGAVEPNIAKTLKDGNYDRVFFLWNKTDEVYPEAGWIGGLFPSDPGSETWAYKSINGATVDSTANLTPTQKQNVLNYNGNVYVTIGGQNITLNGTMSSGRFIDIRRGVDWLQARIEENVYSRIVNLKKVPYTDQGVAIIQAEIEAVLREAVRKGVLSPDPAPYVEAPLVAEVSSVDRANRLLPDVKFYGTLAGAIHKVQIRGTVSI